MASRAQVVLRGRFKPGSQVRLVKVRDERALRAEGGQEVGTATVDDGGAVKFTSGVEVGARYFVVGQIDGRPEEVRARGRRSSDAAEVLEQAPVGPDRLRLSDGSFLDEVPERRPVPSIDVGPGPGQDQVPEGTVQRSDTPRGSAHPVDVELQEPVRRQEDVPDDVVQMSDTPTGAATEIVSAPSRQEDVPKGLLQRSDTPAGVATPFPKGDAIAAQQQQESPLAKESRGEPTKAAAVPLDVKKLSARQRPAKDRPADQAPPAADQPADGELDTSGRDAEGQPAAEDVAAAAGVKPAAKPAEPVRRPARRKTSSTRKTTAKSRKSSARKPAAKKKGS